MLISVLATLLGVLAVALAAAGWACLRLRRSLSRYDTIADAEAYEADCVAKAERSVAQSDTARADLATLQTQIEASQKQVEQYREAVNDFKSAADLKRYVKRLGRYAEGCKTVADLHAKIEHQTQLIGQLESDAAALGYAVDRIRSEGDLAQQIAAQKQQLADLKSEVLQIEEVKDLQEFGFYRRRYDHDSSQRYKQQLDWVRTRQKDMIKDKSAATCDTEWTVEGSKAKGRKMINDQIKLLLRAFNGESDAAIAKVTFSNATSMEGRVTRSFEQINKMGQVNQVRIAPKYLELKLEELFLSHEHRIQKQEEKEEQNRIKAQMREEAKVEKELDKARKDAEQAEETKRQALERARAELAAEAGNQTEKLAGLVEKLESELQDALDRKAKAIARAQLTRSGHVYVLSNVGSFGKGVYKIGMTRRLEPLERVKELGSASVPFLFDVHAMIYSEDAPALESELHRRFDEQRVNYVNVRKEFFRVSLAEIQDAVDDLFGTVTFVTEHAAEEYRQSVARLAEIDQQAAAAEPALAG